MKTGMLAVVCVLLIGMLIACGGVGQKAAMTSAAVPTTGSSGGGGQKEAMSSTTVPTAAVGDLCSLVPAATVAAILGRDLVSAPAPFTDFQGMTVSGCQWDGGKDTAGKAYFAYAAVLAADAFTGAAGGTAVPGLGDAAYAVNGPDAEQLWVRVGAEKAIVVAIGDAPNRNGAIQLARALLGFQPAAGQAAQPTTVAAQPTSAPAAERTNPNETIACAQLLSPDEVKLLLNSDSATLGENSYPGGTSCVWEYTPRGGTQKNLFSVQVAWSDTAVPIWEATRKSELSNEPSELVINSIDGLGDENYTWVSKLNDRRAVYVRQGARTFILRFDPTEVLALQSESQIIDFANRVLGRF